MGKRVIVFLLLFFSPAVVGAAQLKSYKITSEAEAADVRANLLITLFNDGDSELKIASLALSHNSEVLSARDTYGELPYTVSGKEATKISFTFSQGIKPGEERVVMIALKAPLVSRKDDYSEYLLVINPRQDVKDFEHILRLPVGAELFSPKESFPTVIPTAEISKASGVVILAWRTSLEADHPAVFLVRYKSPYYSLLRTIAYALSAVALLAMSILGGRELRRRRQKARVLDSLKILNERERLVVAEVIRSEGIKQNELMQRLGYTKSSLSKIVSRLEARGIVKRIKSGKINRLYPGDAIR